MTCDHCGADLSQTHQHGPLCPVPAQLAFADMVIGICRELNDEAANDATYLSVDRPAQGVE